MIKPLQFSVLNPSVDQVSHEKQGAADVLSEGDKLTRLYIQLKLTKLHVMMS